MQEQPSGDVCAVCKKEVQGGFDVSTKDDEDGKFTIEIQETADRDFNDCDLCNTRVHFRCSRHPESGYCDDCYRKLFRNTTFVGRVRDLRLR